MTIYKISQYRHGLRFVVIAESVDTAGAVVVFGPGSRDACEAWCRANGVECA